MAARENQGLQIALIIFVMLTIVLIVTTYMFFRSYSDERDKGKSLAQQNSDMDSKMRQAIDEASNFKLLITSAENEDLEALRAAAEAEHKAHGEGLPEAEKNYRGLVARLVANLRKAEANNAELAAQVQELKDKLKANNDATQAQANQYTEKFSQASSDLESERKTFGKDRTEITAQKEKQAADFFSPAMAEDVVCLVSDCYLDKEAAEQARAEREAKA